jgi:hypothetical protein
VQLEYSAKDLFNITSLDAETWLSVAEFLLSNDTALEEWCKVAFSVSACVRLTPFFSTLPFKVP